MKMQAGSETDRAPPPFGDNPPHVGTVGPTMCPAPLEMVSADTFDCPMDSRSERGLYRGDPGGLISSKYHDINSLYRYRHSGRVDGCTPTKVVFTAGLQAARKAPKAKKEDANKKAA